MESNLMITNDQRYKSWITEIKHKIRSSQQKAFVKVNGEMLKLYWNLGEDIIKQEAESIWGSGFFNTMSNSLKTEFPELSGFSVTNLKYMKRFYLFYCRMDVNRQQLVDDLCKVPWGHHILIFSKCKTHNEAKFYINKTIENGWSRNLLLNNLDTDFYCSHGNALTNFSKIFPDPHSQLAKEALKDPYNFDFLALSEEYKEKDLEDALIKNITRFLLELGQGFAFVGKQVPLQVGTKELVIDLLFYHIDLKCYVVVELKISEFEPGFAGQLGTYVVAVNHNLKKDSDNETLGLLICKTKDNIIAEYSLEASSQPIGISEYNLSNLLPKNYIESLPSVEDIEKSIKNLCD